MERNGIEYDEATGFPKLPVGLYWQIEDRKTWLRLAIVFEFKYVKSFLGIKYGGFSRYEVHEDLYRSLNTDYLSDDEIKDKAEAIYKEYADAQAAKDRVDSLIGLYPPKKL